MSPERLRGTGLERLISLMERLRGDEGCPWDRAQTLKSLRPFIIEEAYEVVSAIDSGDRAHIKDELGDLLFQVIFSCRLLEEAGDGDINEVMEGSVEKMIRRHPHVFGDERLSESDEVLRRWREIKKEEDKVKKKTGLLHDIPAAMPSLMRALKISKKAARVGFEWPDLTRVMDKVSEELRELHEAIENKDKAAMEEELGDLLFTIVNAARALEVSPEEALRKTLVKFVERFHFVEEKASEKGGITATEMAELEGFWDEAKRAEKEKRT